MIKETLRHIEEQIGLKLKPCDYFDGVNENKGLKYFNIVLEARTSESLEYDLLVRFADRYKSIKVEPNGLNRVAIFPLRINCSELPNSSRKKNCHNCKHLEWIEAEENDSSGFVCNKRPFVSYRQEAEHLDKLTKIEYREKSKVCCEFKNN